MLVVLLQHLNAKATYIPVESTEIIKGIDGIANYYDRTVGYFPVVAVDLKSPEIDKNCSIE